MSSQLVLKYVRDEGYVNVVKQNHQCKRMGQIKFETTSCSRQGLKSDFGFDGDPAGRGPKRGYSSVDADKRGGGIGDLMVKFPWFSLEETPAGLVLQGIIQSPVL